MSVHSQLAASGLRQQGIGLKILKRIVPVASILFALLAASCDLRPADPLVEPSPTTQPTHTPVPAQLQTATPGIATGPAQWRPASDGIPDQIGVAGVAVAPSDSSVVYLAAYEPGGIYRSRDAGRTWHPAASGVEAVAHT